MIADATGTPQVQPAAPPAGPGETIPRLRRAARGGAADSETSFASLRAQGLQLVQALSGKVWTDYNLHDPGVTLLEQLCYALTELVYRAEFPVADHLSTAGRAGIDYGALSLHPPHEAFPCRAASAADYRRVLLDEVAGLDDAELDATPPTASGAPALGLYRLQLKRTQGVMPGIDRRLSQARAAYRARRNLGEDIDPCVTLVEDLWCSLQIDVELGGPRDAASVLAEIYAVCARHIVQACSFQSLDELLAQGRTLEEIYTGPVTRQGFMRDDDDVPRDQLFVSDLGNQVKAIDGVQQLRRLALQRDNEARQLARLGLEAEGAATNMLRWRGAGWALRLRVPGLSPDLLEAGPIAEHVERHVRLRRRGGPVAVAPAELASLLADLGAGSLARRNGHLPHKNAPLPRGQSRDLQRYFSVQNDLPAVYGLGAQGLPATATTRERAQAQQLKTYLVLFEQVIAHSAAQIQHLRDLFSARGALGPSYWWQMLGNATVPGLDAIYHLPPEAAAADGGPAPAQPAATLHAAVQARVYEPHDPRADRRSRALDHLLALQGAVYTQNSMRQFCGYLSPPELEAALLKNKAGFLRNIVGLSRDRAAGLDYSRPSWNRADNTSGLQRRVSWLLGFRLPHSRSLTRAFRRFRLTLVDAEAHRLRQGPLLGLTADPGPAAAVPMHRARPPWTRAAMRSELEPMAVLGGGDLSEALLRCGVNRERYRWTGVPDDPAAAAPAGVNLLLGPDEAGLSWPLGHYQQAGDALHAAESLRRFLLHLSLASEGLHVVEHLLLRPLGTGPEHARLGGLPPDYYAQRLTAVFPSWSVRCHDENFQRLAAETVQRNCPAHIATRCLWLGYAEMLEFEVCYAAWLEARIAFCAAAGEALDECTAAPAAVARLDAAACRLIECLRKAWPAASDRDV